MGMKLTTLSLYGAEPAAVEPLLEPSDVLRAENLPWLTVATSVECEPQPNRRLWKLARQLTKGTEVTALLFNYFDDDLFSCELYQDGRKCASCRSGASWASLGKRLDALFGDKLASKAFRYAQRCCSLEEQVKLLEEAVGAAVFDDVEFSPRTVTRGDAVLRTVKAREVLLRKRANQFVLTEVPFEEWPGCAKLQQSLFAFLKAQVDSGELTYLPFPSYMRKLPVPNAENIAAFPYSGRRSNKDYLLIYDRETGAHRTFGPFSEPAEQVLWRTKDGAFVTLFHNVLHEEHDETSYSRRCGRGEVRCLSPKGDELWRFAPEAGTDWPLKYVHTAPNGVITLFTGPANAYIWQLDGETGALLRSIRIPGKATTSGLVYAASVGTFIYYDDTTEEFVLLNDLLEEIRRLPCSGGSFFREEQFCGELFWNGFDYKTAHLLDLRSGVTEKVRFEISAYPIATLSDGRILGVPEQRNALLVFDRAGTLLARCKLPAPGKLTLDGFPVSVSGMIGEVIQDGEAVYIIERREPDTHGFIFSGYYDHVSIHVWRLDPAGKQQTQQNAEPAAVGS